MNPPGFQTRSAEAYYAKGFLAAAVATGLNTLPSEDGEALSVKPFLSAHWIPGASDACARAQKLYFTRLDDQSAEIDSPCSREKTYTKQFQAQVKSVKNAFAAMKLHVPLTRHSFSVVLEAAVWLLRAGVVNVRGERCVNVKQARCLFHVAAWIQKKQTGKWLQSENSELKVASKKRKDWHLERAKETFLQVLSGAAGTGKTTMVLLMEHLHDHFFGDSGDKVSNAVSTESTFAKTAPTNTAARINGGDTCHAFYKLPLHNLRSKRGKLSSKVLPGFRKRMKPIMGQVIDEMSMLTPQQNHQIDYRCKEGQLGGYSDKYDYGGIGTTLAGDFFQMPPVRKTGLAKDMDLDDEPDEECDEMTGFDKIEHRSGFDLWRRGNAGSKPIFECSSCGS